MTHNVDLSNDSNGLPPLDGQIHIEEAIEKINDPNCLWCRGAISSCVCNPSCIDNKCNC